MAINPCSRCGKERIVSKTWKEKIKTGFGDSIVIHTENVCPDKECQKLVNKELNAQKAKRDKIKVEREQRADENLQKNKKAKLKALKKALKKPKKKK